MHAIMLLCIICGLQKLHPLGLMGKNGIILVETRSGDMREPLRDPSMKIEGLSKPLTFNIQNYTRDQQFNKPDFKSTIYWNPSIKTNSSGKATVEFYCSDDVGPMTIRIDGLTNKGQAFSTTHQIVVASKEN